MKYEQGDKHDIQLLPQLRGIKAVLFYAMPPLREKTMTAAYFEDHPTDPDKVILRKPKHDFERQEPVAWISAAELMVMRGNALGGAKDWRVNVGLVKQDGDVGLYTTPPQRTWVGLTEDELFKIWMGAPAETEDRFAFVNAVITKLKELNT